jgi:hypothetical protein
MDRSELVRFARLGASARLTEIERERQAIFREFPDLRRARPQVDGTLESDPAAGRGGRRKRKKMSAAQRKAVSERMRKYWAGRAAEGTKKQAGQSDKAASPGRRKMSAAARKRIADAQKARWAKFRKKKGSAAA